MVFGWKARTEGDGIIPIEERGSTLAALVDILEHFHERHSANNVLKKWIVDILKGLEKVYALHGTQIPSVSQPKPVAPSINSTQPTVGAKRPRSETLEATDSQPESKSKKKGERVVYETKKKKEPGRAPDEVASALVIRFKYKDPAEGFAWKCIAPTCTYEAEGNVAKPRVIKHASTCKKLKEWNYPLFLQAVNASKSGSLSAQVSSSTQPTLSSESSVALPASIPLSGTTSTPTLATEQRTLPVEAFKAAGRKRAAEEKRIQQLSIDKDIMVFLCVHGITPSVVDSPFWKKIVRRIPGYDPTPATTFKDSYIPKEANWVRDQQIQLLKRTRNLTLTFDGTTIRKPHSFYTTHATTPQREVFFLGAHGDRVTPERHTTNWITDRLMEDIREVGKGNWAAACSDNTNVTKAARRETVALVPTMFDLNDSIHHIHGTIRAVTGISHFKEMITLLRAILKHFKKSPLSVKHVQEEWVKVSPERFKSFKSIAKTRFGTMYVSAKSVRPYLGIIRSLVAEKKVTFKSTHVQGLFSNRSLTSKFPWFQLVLDQYIDIVEPMIRALWCLESAFANPSDVYAFWLAIGATLKKLFLLEVNDGGVPLAVANEVTCIFNQKYKEFFERSDIYFAAFMLDPRYAREDFLKEVNASTPASQGGQTMQSNPDRMSLTFRPRSAQTSQNPDTIPFPAAYERLKRFCKDFLRKLCEFADANPGKGHPLLQEIGSWAALQEFKQQLPQFWNRMGIWLVADSVKDENPLEWWESMGSNKYGRVLGIIGQAVFSILANSMPDERTNSAITWLNSAIRGSQYMETVVDHIQIRQWYTTHALPDGPDFAKLRKGKNAARYRPVVKFSRLDDKTIKRLSGEDDNADNAVGKGLDAAGEEEIVVLDPQAPPNDSLQDENESDSEIESEAVDSIPDDARPLTFFDDVVEREVFRVDDVINLDALDLLTFLSSKLSSATTQATENSESRSNEVESGTDARHPRKAQASDWEDD